jgi:hypothetical protein
MDVPGSGGPFALSFEDGVVRHGYCGYQGYRDWSALNLLPPPPTPVSLASVDRMGDLLVLTFEQPIDPGILSLLYGPTPDGPWTPAAERPAVSPRGDHILNWKIVADPHSLRYIRVTAHIGDEPVDLFTDVLGRTDPRRTLVPVGIHPNPSPHEVAWRLEVDRPTRVLFEVFDLLGRRVHGPEAMVLEPGSREIRWKGLRQGRLGGGVYFLSVTGDGFRSVAKVVLVRN